MTDRVTIEKINSVNLRVLAERGILQELSEAFCFDVPGAKFSPKFKAGFWDGKIRMVNSMTGVAYYGLKGEIIQYCQRNGYEVDDQTPTPPEVDNSDIAEFVDSLPLKMKPAPHQMLALAHCVKNERAVILSPTASGKSYIIYLLSKYYGARRKLVIVPTISLVKQMQSDLIEYGEDPDNIQIIMGGESKVIGRCGIVISTWQSVVDLPPTWFDNFQVCIGDEVHGFKAKSLVKIMEKVRNCDYRFGLTGTLDGSETNKLTLIGLFGPVKRVIHTHELIKKNHVADIHIKALVLKHDVSKLPKKADYNEQRDFIISSSRRLNFVCKLALATKEPTLVLFQFVEKHGIPLYERMKELDPTRPIYFASGSTTSGEEREHIRKLIGEIPNVIIVASVGIFSTGVNAPALRNLISAAPTKSQVRILQSIGRALRKSEGKDMAVIYDIADDLGSKKNNYFMEHFKARLEIYEKERFPYKVSHVDLQ